MIAAAVTPETRAKHLSPSESVVRKLKYLLFRLLRPFDQPISTAIHEEKSADPTRSIRGGKPKSTLR